MEALPQYANLQGELNEALHFALDKLLAEYKLANADFLKKSRKKNLKGGFHEDNADDQGDNKSEVFQDDSDEESDSEPSSSDESSSDSGSEESGSPRSAVTFESQSPLMILSRLLREYKTQAKNQEMPQFEEKQA